MNIIELKERQYISQNIESTKIYIQFGNLLKELNKKQLPVDITERINQDIREINTTNKTGNELIKLVKQKQKKVITLVEKQLKITPKKHYSKLWLANGMATFGLPIGTVFGLSIGNMAMLPIGLAIGAVVGSGMDKKASVEGRQLDIEIN
ncbi:hypothetical protein [Adhaeribacter aquaticus]|uniref:hypothetical protein n=1 Tax=Adhaeribacter aquaticus TaxID=299567 RepID=UPI000478B5E7|nr:hypothetical protein [Adhaeribacter aquaticus]